MKNETNESNVMNETKETDEINETNWGLGKNKIMKKVNIFNNDFSTTVSRKTDEVTLLHSLKLKAREKFAQQRRPLKDRFLR